MMTQVVYCTRAVTVGCRQAAGVCSGQALSVQPTHFSRPSLIWKKGYATGPRRHSQWSGSRGLSHRKYLSIAACGTSLGVFWYYRWAFFEPFFPVKQGHEVVPVAANDSKLQLMERAQNVMANLTKSLSRTWGSVTSTEIPKWLRFPLYSLYIKAFDCNMEEVETKDLTHYRSIQEFFTRRLAPGVRPVDGSHCVVSPSDGKILHFGTVEHARVEQVKGITYCLHDFLGEASCPTTSNRDDEQHGDRLRQKPDSLLFHCVIYLAPGNYHGFHSPADWTATLRRHFPGSHLLSVRPSTVSWMPDIYILNERVVLLGDWQHGFFSMAAVGAFNVGSIRIFSDEKLKTNQKGQAKVGKDSLSLHFDNKDLRHGNSEMSVLSVQDRGLAYSKGESVGEFNMGSTIVLIFEAPENFEFKISSGQEIKYGQPIGTCDGGILQ